MIGREHKHKHCPWMNKVTTWKFNIKSYLVEHRIKPSNYKTNIVIEFLVNTIDHINIKWPEHYRKYIELHNGSNGEHQMSPRSIPSGKVVSRSKIESSHAIPIHMARDNVLMNNLSMRSTTLIWIWIKKLKTLDRYEPQ